SVPPEGAEAVHLTAGRGLGAPHEVVVVALTRRHLGQHPGQTRLEGLLPVLGVLVARLELAGVGVQNRGPQDLQHVDLVALPVHGQADPEQSPNLVHVDLRHVSLLRLSPPSLSSVSLLRLSPPSLSSVSLLLLSPPSLSS